MFWRSATLAGLALLMLSGAACSNGEKTTADSDDSQGAAVPAQVTPAMAEQKPADQEAIEIPLSEIWALNMPGTRDVGELDPNAETLKEQLERIKTLPPKEMEEQFRPLYNNSLVGQIRESLEIRRDVKPGPGFAVSGPVSEVLKTVRDVLTGETKRTDSLPVGSDVTAVFFSRQTRGNIQIYKVERLANVLEIQYRINPRYEPYVSEYLALIPLGRLSSGSYQVKVVLGPVEQKYRDVGVEEIPAAQAAKSVCGSFEFEVR